MVVDDDSDCLYTKGIREQVTHHLRVCIVQWQNQVHNQVLFQIKMSFSKSGITIQTDKSSELSHYRLIIQVKLSIKD